VGRLRKSGWPVAGSFIIQCTNAVHDQTWKLQSVGFGVLGNMGARLLDSNQPNGAMQGRGGAGGVWARRSTFAPRSKATAAMGMYRGLIELSRV
jgi:hypothetical protein